MDIARSIYRKRNHLRENAWKINQLRWSLEDEEAAAQDELLYRQAEDCLAELTPEQREVIELTVRQQKSLSEWAMRRGVSYEAARRMRERGVNSLRRCVERKSADGDGEVL
ncbi:MAG: hypothetical protein OXJ55_11015 [Caldilineaceae bacterium]|nr:hypothetical protein [Caldilineaceae bacterium]